jgi:hypothetical protein
MNVFRAFIVSGWEQADKDAFQTEPLDQKGAHSGRRGTRMKQLEGVRGDSRRHGANHKIRTPSF